MEDHHFNDIALAGTLKRDPHAVKTDSTKAIQQDTKDP